jgi:hypothetical protein
VRFASPREILPYWVFFAGVALTSAGSAWYHLAPDDARLVWDRLPMTIAFMSLVAAVVSERIDVRIGNLLLWPLVLLGLASVVYWRWSALAGFENLRPYLAVQFGSIAVVLAVSLLYRSRYTRLIFVLAAGPRRGEGGRGLRPPDLRSRPVDERPHPEAPRRRARDSPAATGDAAAHAAPGWTRALGLARAAPSV